MSLDWRFNRGQREAASTRPPAVVTSLTGDRPLFSLIARHSWYDREVTSQRGTISRLHAEPPVRWAWGDNAQLADGYPHAGAYMPFEREARVKRQPMYLVPPLNWED